MFGLGAITEVAIGLIFVYILLSLLVSQINNFISAMLKIRARQLRERIGDIVDDEEMRVRVLSHPIVNVVKPPKVNTPQLSEQQLELANVVKVSGTTFAKAMINILSDPYLDYYAALTLMDDAEEREYFKSLINELKVNINNPTNANAIFTEISESVMELEPSDRGDRVALLSTLGPLQESIRDIQSGNSRLLLVLDGVSRVNNRALQRSLETVLSTVQDINDAHAAIENWYNNRMEQTSQLYANTMQYLSFFVGLFIAILLNIDTLFLSQTLWEDPAVRENVAAAAARYTQAQEQLIAPTDASGEPAALSDDQFAQLQQSYVEAEATLNTLLELRLPIGWVFRTSPETQTSANGESIITYDPATDGRNLANLVPGLTGNNWFVAWINKIAGIAITAMATAQGAPFWFDILRRLTGQKSPSSTGSNTVSLVAVPATEEK